MRMENEAGRLAPDLFLFFKKALYEVKASGLQIIVSIYFDMAINLTYNKNKLIKF